MSDHSTAPDAAAILAALAEASDEAMATTDLDARILTWSAGAARLYGYADAEIVGRSMADLMPPGQQGIVAANYARLRDGHRVEQFDTSRVRKDGRLVQVTVTLAPIRDASGAITSVLSLSRDIGGQKRSDAALQASQERWRALLDSAVDAIVVIDARGRIEAFNRAAERLFGYSERDVVRRNVSMLMPSPYRDEHDSYLARYMRDGDPRVIGIGREVTAQRRDGTTFPVHLSVGEMEVDGERKFTGILHDLSKRAELEEQLREQAALVRLGEMAAVIAHEVKNPLAGIRGAIQVIGGRLPAGSPEAGVTTEIVARIDALSELMKDMLLFARPPRPQPAPVDLSALVQSTAELLTSDPAMGGVSVSLEGGAPALVADPGLLKIVFVNLLANSAHAMKGQGEIRVTIGEEARHCTITISDEGPGIPPDVREKVFTPFFTTKSRGTGLGLSTARRVIEAHQGTIGIDCPPHGGTRVTIRLPLPQ